MVVIKQAVIAEPQTGFLRGDVRVGIDESHALQARLRLALFQKYHADDIRKDYALFQRRLAATGIEESFENPLYVEELLAFLDQFETAHQEIAQHLQQIAPKEMVEMVSGNLAEDAKLRRAEIRRQAHELVETYKLKLNEHEKRLLEERIATAISSSAGRAQTPQGFRSALQKSLSELLAQDQYVETSVRQLVDADPVVAQRLLLGNPTNESVVVERMLALDPPAWPGYVAAIENAHIMPVETIQTMIDHVASLGRTAAFLSTDLAQAPATRTTPGALVGAILQASGNKTALKAFEKLTEQAQNAVALTSIRKALDDAVESIKSGASDARLSVLNTIINQGRAEWGQSSGGTPLKSAASLIGDLTSFLRPALERYINVELINRSLPPGNKILPDKAGTLLTTPQEVYVLAAYNRWPQGVTFVLGPNENPLVPALVTVRVADTVFGRILDRAVKSEAAGGVFRSLVRPILAFFGFRVGGAAAKVAGEGVKRGIAALLTKLGLSALAAVFTGGTSLLAQAAIWVGGKVLSGLWRAGSWLLSARWLTSLLGFGSAPGKPKQWYEQDWVPIVIIIAVAVLIPMFGAMMQITTQNAALVTSATGNQPDVFMEHETYPPPDYIDLTGLESREFFCLTYGEGISTSYGHSERLSSNQKTKIEAAIAAYPQIKLLSCSINCSSPINVTAFNKDAAYAGYAPSSLSGNIVFYPKAFRFTTQNLTKLLAHELSHNIDWRNAALASGFYALGCEQTGTYPAAWGETPEETFAEAVGLYMIGWPKMASYCGGKALGYFNSQLNQCR